MHRVALTVMALLFSGIFALWWMCFHNKRVETAVWLDTHHSQLAQIRSELDAHPSLCKVWIGEPPDVLCGKHLTASDKAAFRKVAVVLADMDGFDASREPDYHGRLGRVSIGIFGQSFVSPPEYADWYADKNSPFFPQQSCTPIGLLQWYACDGRVGFM